MSGFWLGRRELAAHRPAREEVADAVVAVAGRVGALGVAVGAGDRCDVQRVDDLERVEVAERLAHRAGVGALPGADALADHPVLDQVPELVAVDREVVGAVHARGVERAGQRLPDELVRRRMLAVGARAHVRVVAATGGRAGLRVADQAVVAERRGTGPPGGGVGSTVVTPLLYCWAFQWPSSKPR